MLSEANDTCVAGSCAISDCRASGSEIAISIEHPVEAELRQQLEGLAPRRWRLLSYLVRRVLRVAARACAKAGARGVDGSN